MKKQLESAWIDANFDGIFLVVTKQNYAANAIRLTCAFEENTLSFEVTPERWLV